MGPTALVETRGVNVGPSVLERSQAHLDRGGYSCVGRFAHATCSAALDAISQSVTPDLHSVIGGAKSQVSEDGSVDPPVNRVAPSTSSPSERVQAEAGVWAKRPTFWL